MNTINPSESTRDETPKNVFNPLNDDLVVQLRDDNNEHVSYTVPFFKTSTYPTYIADRLIKRLVDALIEDRKLGYVTPQERLKIQQEVEV